MALLFLPCISGAASGSWRMGWNPNDKGAGITLSNGYLTAAYTTGSAKRARGFKAHGSSGKFYFEVVLDTIAGGNNAPEMGLMPASTSLTGGVYAASGSGAGWGMWTNVIGSGQFYCGDNSTSHGPYGGPYANGDVAMCAVDFGASKVWFGVNGTWFASGNPGAGTNPMFSNISGDLYPAVYVDSTAQATARFAPESWGYTAPSGFVQW